MSKIASDAAPFTRPSGSDWSTAPAESVEHFVSKLNALLAKEGAAVELDGLPAGYELLQQRRTTGNHVDRYLYGHSNGTSRFRSVNEFVPHVLFLAGGRAAECRCKYCGGGSGGGPRQAAAASAAAAATPAKNGDAPPRQAKTERKRTSADAAVGAQPPDAAKPAARRQTWNSQSTAALLEVAVEDNSNKNNNSDSKTKKANVFADPFFKFKKAQPAEALPKPASKKPTPKKPAPLSASAAESSSETSFKTVSVDPSFKFKKVDDSQPASASAKSPKMTAETTSMPPVSVSPSIKSPVPPPSQPKPPISVAPVAPPPTAPAASTVAPTRSIANPLARKLSITSIDASQKSKPIISPKDQTQAPSQKHSHQSQERRTQPELSVSPYMDLSFTMPDSSSLPSAPLSATERSLPTATDAPITTQPISASQKITPAISDEKKLERGPSAEDISKAQALLFKKSNDDLQEMKARQKALAPKPPLQNKQIVVPTNIPTLQKALPSASVPTKTASLPPPNPAVPQPPNQQNPQPIPTQSVPKKRKLNGTNLPVSNPATQESKPGNPTTPIFRVNDLVFIEVLITSKYPEQTHLTLPNTAHPKSKPLTINIQSIHDTCVFWPAVIRQVHQFTPQRILWTTPIMIETTTTPANLNLSTAACFGDTIETLTRDVENGVQVTRRHRRPSYTVSLLCITNGQVVLPELYITPWRFVSVPKDLFPAGFEMGHIDSCCDLSGGGGGDEYPVKTGYDYAVVCYLRSLVKADQIMKRERKAPKLVDVSGYVSVGGVGVVVGSEVVTVGDCILVEDGGVQEEELGDEDEEDMEVMVIRKPGRRVVRVTKVGGIDPVTGRIKLSGVVCHRMESNGKAPGKNFIDFQEPLDVVGAVKRRKVEKGILLISGNYQFGKRVNLVADNCVGRVYSTFPLVDLG